jgi:DNA-binding transcriptional MerR regulator
MQGRVADYGDEHLLVLAIIKRLKDQQNLPLDTIKQMLEIRATQGEVMMNLALKQRLLRPLSASGQNIRLTRETLIQQAGTTAEYINELTKHGLLFPIKSDNEEVYNGDDALLIELYERLEYLGLPIALAALIRFQLRQLARSELAAFEQHIYPRWRDEGLSQKQQAEQMEAILTLTDTLISIMHRRLIYQV